MAKGLWEDALHDAGQVGHFCFPQILHIDAESLGHHTGSIGL